MAAPRFTPDYLDATLDSGAAYAYTDAVSVEDASQVGAYIVHRGTTQDIKYKFQVSNVLVPSVDADWADLVPEASLTQAAGSVPFNYLSGLPFRHVRIGYLQNISTEPLTIAISTKRDKVV